MKTLITPSSLYVNMIVSAWEAQNTRLDKLLASLSDDELKKETAAGRNTGAYLLGHLAAVNDAMLPLLGFGPKLHPELEEIFLKNPESAPLEKPSLEKLKACWKAINEKLTASIHELSADQWLTRHNSVSEDDFQKDPTRNKLNVLVNRANHQAYHIGQMTYLTKRK